GGGGAINRAGEALLDEVGQVAAVVDVRVAEQDGVDVARAERELRIAAAALGPVALEQPAVQQQRLPAGVHPVHGAGDGAGGAPEGDGQPARRLAFPGHPFIVGRLPLTGGPRGAVACGPRSNGHLRWRILLRMRRFLRPTLRRPLPRRRLPMLTSSELACPTQAENIEEVEL